MAETGTCNSKDQTNMPPAAIEFRSLSIPFPQSVFLFSKSVCFRWRMLLARSGVIHL